MKYNARYNDLVYLVVANGTIMIEGCSASKALNVVCNVLCGGKLPIEVKVYYQDGNETVGFYWKLENSFKVTGR